MSEREKFADAAQYVEAKLGGCDHRLARFLTPSKEVQWCSTCGAYRLAGVLPWTHPTPTRHPVVE